MHLAPHLVLASASPRRRQLLEEAGLQFGVVVADVREVASTTLTIRELATQNATLKAVAVARTNRHAVVLAADTLVALDGLAIGKPANRREAFRTLQRLSGREHQVCTAVFICSVAQRRKISFHVFSQVRFRTLTVEMIQEYFSRIDPLDKAGAYAAQGHGSEVIEKIRGSFTNVVGLPMGETLRALKRFNVRPGPLVVHPSSYSPAGVRQQISSLLPSGSSKKKA